MVNEWMTAPPPVGLVDGPVQPAATPRGSCATRGRSRTASACSARRGPTPARRGLPRARPTRGPTRTARCTPTSGRTGRGCATRTPACPRSRRRSRSRSQYQTGNTWGADHAAWGVPVAVGRAGRQRSNARPSTLRSHPDPQTRAVRLLHPAEPSNVARGASAPPRSVSRSTASRSSRRSAACSSRSSRRTAASWRRSSIGGGLADDQDRSAPVLVPEGRIPVSGTVPATLSLTLGAQASSARSRRAWRRTTWRRPPPRSSRPPVTRR